MLPPPTSVLSCRENNGGMESGREVSRHNCPDLFLPGQSTRAGNMLTMCWESRGQWGAGLDPAVLGED